MANELRLLTDDELDALRAEDERRDREYNLEHDNDFNFDSFSRKWRKRIPNAKHDWELIRKLSVEQFLALAHWLSVEDEPVNPNPGGGRPGLVKELARDIKYAMSSKQRAVAYRIVAERYDRIAADADA